jgi:hypothetical protein
MLEENSKWQNQIASTYNHALPPFQNTNHFEFFRYIHFIMYVDILIIYVYNRENVSWKTRMTSILKRKE